MKNLLILAAAAIAFTGTAAVAYDGTNCSAPGICWEPKPGFPAKIAGSEFDPKHDPAELSKQGESLLAMDQRNALRVAHFKKTGEFIYDVTKIPAQ